MNSARPSDNNAINLFPSSPFNSICRRKLIPRYCCPAGRLAAAAAAAAAHGATFAPPAASQAWPPDAKPAASGGQAKSREPAAERRKRKAGLERRLEELLWSNQRPEARSSLHD